MEYFFGPFPVLPPPKPPLGGSPLARRRAVGDDEWDDELESTFDDALDGGGRLGKSRDRNAKAAERAAVAAAIVAASSSSLSVFIVLGAGSRSSSETDK
jgi:hypothetical protein